jgi:LPXTG-motif cell wall-anchored protein/TQXA domain-containing protein
VPVRSIARAIAALFAVTLFVIAAPAYAHTDPSKPPARDTRAALADPGGSVTLTGLGSGGAVTGFNAPASFDPLDGYPASGYNTMGYTPHNVGWSGTIIAEGASGVAVEMYCIDLHTETNIGLSYKLGTWGEGNVPNTGYVARILNENFPNTTAPASQATNANKAAAVQAAIWFFTDDYVLASGDPRFATTSQIVAGVLAAGPLPEPAAPVLKIAGPTTGYTGEVTGPFTLHSSSGQATVSATGATMYSDAGASIPIANGATVPDGTQIYLKVADPSTVELNAAASITAPSGSVFLYVPANPSNPTPAKAQKLILARQQVVNATAVTKVTFDVRPTATPSSTVSGGGGALPNTGSNAAWIAMIGLGVVASGVALLVIRRRLSA